MTWRTWRTLLLCGLGALACSSESSQTASSHSDTVVRIVATDEGFQHPDSIPSGMTHVVLENRGTTIHEVMFVKLPDGMTGEAYVEAVKSGIDFPEGALDYSGPGLTSVGRAVETWLDLDPGRYLLACWFTGHVESTPVHIVTVHPGTSGVSPPAPDATIRLIDYRIEVEGELKAGTHVLRVETVGPSMHEVDIFRFHEGKTVDDLREWKKDERASPAPADAFGGVLDNHDIGRVVWLKTELIPGRYVLWCGMPMVMNATGPAGDVSHSDAGMFKEFVIADNP